MCCMWGSLCDMRDIMCCMWGTLCDMRNIMCCMWGTLCDVCEGHYVIYVRDIMWFMWVILCDDCDVYACVREIHLCMYACSYVCMIVLVKYIYFLFLTNCIEYNSLYLKDENFSFPRNGMDEDTIMMSWSRKKNKQYALEHTVWISWHLPLILHYWICRDGFLSLATRNIKMVSPEIGCVPIRFLGAR
jgi:hypothetical protein